MILKVYTDGGSKGNPGPAAVGVAFYEGDKRIDTYREDIGRATNNDAEYTAVVRALEIVHTRQGDSWNGLAAINFHCDSQLVVSQLTGVYKIKKPHIQEYVNRIRVLEQKIAKPVTYTYIPREKNTVADALVNNALKD